MTDTTTPAPETAVPLAETASGNPQANALHLEFRSNKDKILAAEAGDYERLIPGFDLIPEAQRGARLRQALQEITRRQFTLTHMMQTSSAGPRTKKASPSASATAAVDSALKGLDDMF